MPEPDPGYDSWDTYFIEMADLAAQKSKDPSMKVGAVIVGEGNEVLSTGFNGFPIGVDDEKSARYTRPMKYEFTEHAERNAIFLAARHGTQLQGATLYFNWHPQEALCPKCARAIIQAGIVEVVGPTRSMGESKDWTHPAATAMIEEADVSMRVVGMDSATFK